MQISDSLRNEYVELIRLEDEAQITYDDLCDAIVNFHFNEFDPDAFRDLCDKRSEAFEHLNEARNKRRFIAMCIVDDLIFSGE